MRAARHIALFVVAVLALTVIAAAARPTLLDAYTFGRAVYDRDGRLLRLSLAGDERYRLFVPLEEIAPTMVDATLLYEDRWFYWHPGINVVALAKAVLQTYVHEEGRRGASTLSMQLARLRFDIDSRTIPGKLEQMARALQLELYYSKRDLLEAYLNLAPYGGNVEGVGAASVIYFDREPDRLSLAEALALTVMPQQPSQRAPTSDGREPVALKVARERLASAWLGAHPEADREHAGLDAPLRMRRRRDLPFLAPHFATLLAGDASRPSRTRTTLDLGLQEILERQVDSYVERKTGIGITNASVMLLDHRDMEVLALVGSADFFDADLEGQVNGTRAKRSPGSALKPFIYGMALDQGLIHPRTLLKDAPMRFGAYNPENFDGEFSGPTSATEALVRSRNVPAVYLTTQLRDGGLYGLLSRAGISDLKSPEHYGLALVLGGMEVTMEELVGLYAMLAGNGALRPLRYQLDTPHSRGVRLMRAEAAHLTLQMLEENPRPGQGFRSEWIAHDLPVAWKTGTSYGYRDAWAVGVVGPWVLAVWVGNFDGRGNPSFVGRRAAAPLFFEVIDALRTHLPRKPPATDADELHLAEVRVCAVSGDLPGEHCRRTRETQFIPGTSPITKCSVHRQVNIDRATGLRACSADPRTSRPEVFEVWPSDLEDLFVQAGMPRRKPPPYAPSCAMAERAVDGNPPAITSPVPEVVYNVRASAGETQSIALTATADADVRSLHWFAGEQYLGEAGRSHTFFWDAPPGDYLLRVVDDSGRSDALAVKVAVVQ